ncbi:phosphotransferase [Brachybacterium subflavum]|uniref:phosphotransferase n=1 Tax=Brachybacterium subflavum TaxID=2585206 RepID=UPI0012665327|nr:phosphotransferase [Brachybacterium subflavum]
MDRTSDGSELLTGPGAGGLLRSAVNNAGGVLRTWELDHVDHRPGRSTKALYRTTVSWPEIDGAQAPAREELFGASAHVGEQEKDLLDAENSMVMTDGDINVRVWRYPHDPWLPMLPKVCYPDVVGRTLVDMGVPLMPGTAEHVPIEVISYRPGRRAVLRAQLPDRGLYLKVMQPRRSGEIVERHRHLLAAGVPVPRVIAHREGLVVLEELPGMPLSRAILDQGVDACRAEDLVAMLDRLPASLFPLPMRPPWTDSIEFYAGIVSSSLPSLGPRVDALVREIREGLAAVGRRQDLSAHDVVHGDFYEAQVFVDGGEVVGVLDIDTVGPGRRADDLACLLAHLSVLADEGSTRRIDPAVQQRVLTAIDAWQEVFRRRVDPTELALRSAGVVLSLATGPHRQQEAAWQAATEAIVRIAERWVEAARTAETERNAVQQTGPTGTGAPGAPAPAQPQGGQPSSHTPPRQSAPLQGPPQTPPTQAPPSSFPGDDSPTLERRIPPGLDG